VYTAYQEPGYTVSDNQPQELTVVVDKSQLKMNVVNDTAQSLGYSIFYSTIDEDENKTVVERKVLVADKEAPEITLLDENPYTIEAGTPYFPDVTKDYKVSDNYCTVADIKVTRDMSGLNTNVGGKSYYVYYDAVDKFGNKAKQKFREVYVAYHTGLENAVQTTNPALSIYPNPSKGTVTINFGDQPIQQLQVLNILGEEVYSQTLTPNNQQVTLDLSALKNGMYLVRMNSDEQTITRKLTISK
jgi:hypothetical protein